MSGPRSEATKAIYAYIKAHQPVQPLALADAFRARAAAVGTSASSWLEQRVANMQAAGFIEQTSRGWVALEKKGGAFLNAPREPKPRQAKAAEVLTTSIAEPRRTSMFDGTYQPPVQVQRAGAGAHAAHPSLINGVPRPYRSAW